MIELKGVDKVFHKKDKEVVALRGIDLKIEEGEFVALRGPSGAGKTTLLFVIGTMIRPSRGQVFLDGRELYALSARERAELRAKEIGFVFQTFHLIPFLTVWENVLLGDLAGVKVPPERAQRVLERLGLWERRDHFPKELSAGERQRTALARILVRQPKVIRADEVTGNLDPENAREVLQYLQEFNQEGGTVLLATHSDFAASFAGRQVQLRDGEVVEA